MVNDKTDFTQGSILKKLVAFMMPVLGALILQAAYGAVDLLVVGRYGSTSGLSGVSTGSQVLNLVTFVVTGREAPGTDRISHRRVGSCICRNIDRIIYLDGWFRTSDFSTDAGTGRSGDTDIQLCTHLRKRNLFYCGV